MLCVCLFMCVCLCVRVSITLTGLSAVSVSNQGLRLLSAVILNVRRSFKGPSPTSRSVGLDIMISDIIALL